MPLTYWTRFQVFWTSPYSLNVKEWKTPLFTFRAVLHTALQKEWWLFHSFRGVLLQDRVKNHSKRCKLQSKRVEDHSKRSCHSYGSSKSAFHSLHKESTFPTPYPYNNMSHYYVPDETSFLLFLKLLIVLDRIMTKCSSGIWTSLSAPNWPKVMR